MMIKLAGVGKRYGDTIAVKDVSFEVAEQENLIMLGTSGCGKTTTLKMINRLIAADEGEIFINGQDIVNQNPEKLRRGIGYVMQHIGLFPHYTIAENIAVVPQLLKWEKEKTTEKITEVTEKLHLPKEALQLFPHELSGGQQQRVGLARALVADPDILLMDEPFGALDNVTRTSIQKEFKALAELKRKTIVMVTHDVQEAFELADRICLMDKGEVIQLGTPKELLFNPNGDFSRKFFDGERLALEFKVVYLADLWSNLVDAAKPIEDALSAQLSVWQAMEELRSGNRDELVLGNEKGEFKKVNFDELTKAFHQYKSCNRYE